MLVCYFGWAMSCIGQGVSRVYSATKSKKFQNRGIKMKTAKKEKRTHGSAYNPKGEVSLLPRFPPNLAFVGIRVWP